MRKMRLVLGLWAIVGLGSLAQAQEAVATIELPGGKTAQVTFTTVDVPGAVITGVIGIDSNGDMVGDYETESGGVPHAFLLSSGIFTLFDYPGAESTVATDINDFGLITGYGEFNGGLIVHGFTYDLETFTTLDYPNQPQTYPFGINNASQVVGTAGFSGSVMNAFENSSNHFRVLRLSGAYLEKTANRINNLGDIVGYLAGGSSADKSFLYRGGTFRPVVFPGADSTYAWGINDNGQIVGWYFIGTRVNSFISVNGKYISLSYPGALSTFAAGINNAGEIVGGYTLDYSTYHGFITSPLGSLSEK